MFLFLPQVLKQKIAEFCLANDGVLALAMTCKVMHRDLSLSVLSKPCQISSSNVYGGGAAIQKVIKEAAIIPVFFANHCHSVRLTWKISIYRWSDSFSHDNESTWTFYVVAGSKQQSLSDTTEKDPIVSSAPPPHAFWIRNEQGEDGKIVWQSPSYSIRRNLPPYKVMMDATFHCEANQRYFLWYQYEGQNTGNDLVLFGLKVDRLLIWDGSQQLRKQIYEKCRELDSFLPEVLGDEFPDDRSRWDRSKISAPNHLFIGTAFLAKLLFLALETIDLEQTNNPNQPIKTFFESNESWMACKELNTAVLMALKLLATVYLQLIEREDGTIGSDWTREPTTSTLTDDDHTATHLVTLPPILLYRMFGWAVKRRDSKIDSEEPKKPQFVTRIPIPSGTISFRLTVKENTYGGKLRTKKVTFLLLAKMPKDYHPVANDGSSDRSILWDSSTIRPDFHVVWHGSVDCQGLDIFLDVVPEAKAYFLYVLPRNTRRNRFEYIQIHLTVLDDENESKLKAFDKLLGLRSVQEYQKTTMCLLFGLLQATAETLIQYKGSYASSGSPSLDALAGLLELYGFPLDGKDELECLAHLTPEFLQYFRNLKALY